MPAIDRGACALLVVDFQARLMPAIDGGAGVLAQAGRLLAAAKLLDVPVQFTEQNPSGLGPTAPELGPPASALQPEPGANAAKPNPCRTQGQPPLTPGGAPAA